MKKKPLGCFSASAIIAFIITLVTVGVVTATSGASLFSPGKLSAFSEGRGFGGVASHSEVGKDCAACHAAPWSQDTMSDRCQVCHTEIKLDVADDTTLHGTLLQKTPELQCRDCHPDHRGPDAPLTEMDLATFPHDVVGFSLASHQTKSDGLPFTCGDCHTQSISALSQATCAECHQQINAAFMQAHELAFGNDCLACHDGLESYGADFDHNQTNFALTGKHTETVCSKCHLDARSIEDFTQASPACAACHLTDDAHDGKFGTDCAVCHTPDAWVPATFNHDLAGFKLLGKHVDVACEDCHINEVYEGTPTDCFSCHEKDDQHNGRFGTDCALCHSPEGWLPANFDHNLAAFKLEGKHQSVDCEACHINGVYQGTPQDCYSCHKQDDQHRGRYGTDCSQCHTAQGWEPANVNHAAFTVGCATCHAQDDAHNGQYGTDCSACHSTNAWKPANFDHSISGFPLTGAHVRVDCQQCHTGGTFSGLSTACAACHADPAFHSGAVGTNCASCHNTSAWVPAGYNRSHPFIADEGGSGINHGGASCRTCHPSTVYSYTCLACHSNNSGGEGGGGDD